ncbi:MAG: GDSL family lipase [Lachnospiraceae bacterium]|nr:GDSL family lipase [Lachnospiraceae bacterium]
MNILEKEKNYRLGGRHTWQKGILYLAYSASYMEFCCEGACTVTAELVSDGIPEGKEYTTWAAVFVNDEEQPSRRFELQKGTNTYTLYAAEQKENVKIRLMKYSEAAFSSLGIKAIHVEGGAILPPPQAPEKLIQFIGDSITCGYGIEGMVNVDVFNTTQENPWNAYACRTARLLNMDFELVSWSGNGVISHYVDETVNEQRHDKPWMQELYPYSDRELEERLGKSEAELTVWNTEHEPDVIVVHLGTNDGSFTRFIEERNVLFVEAYMAFLQQIRALHKEAPIICMLGVMRQELNDQVAKAVALTRQQGDGNVYFIDVPLARDWDGLGTDNHPSPRTQEKMAELLAQYIHFLVD